MQPIRGLWLSKWANQRPGNCHQTHWIHHAPGQKTSITLLVSMSRVITSHEPLIGQSHNCSPLIGSMFPAVSGYWYLTIWPLTLHCDLRGNNYQFSVIWIVTEEGVVDFINKPTVCRCVHYMACVFILSQYRDSSHIPDSIWHSTLLASQNL